MSSSVTKKRAQAIILFCALSTTFIVTPFISLDPISLPKFLILVTCSFYLLGLIVGTISDNWSKSFKQITLAISTFVILGIVSFIFNGASFSQLFGIYGRNTGLLTYFGFAIIFIFTAFVSKKVFARKILVTLVIAGAVNTVYGVIQNLGLDPIDWANPYNPIVGTLGNPNFVSALLGISSIALLSFAFEVCTNSNKAICFFGIGLMLFISYKSGAIQGLGVFLVGAVIVIYSKFVRNKSRLTKSLYWTTVLFSISISIIGILQKGPLGGLLYQDSVTYRGDYWTAGYNIVKSNPFFGIGFDNYEYWYRANRTEAAALRRGPDMTSNSAHNVFLDIASSGGIILLLSYLVVLGLTLRSSIKLLKQTKNFDFIATGLVACWVGFLTQSIVSINQIGLAIWGWILSGSIIGYEIYGDDDLPKLKSHQQLISPKSLLYSGVSLAVGVLISAGPMVQDVAFRNALESSDGVRIKSAALQWPADIYLIDLATEIMLQNEINGFALELSRESVAKNPRNFKGWKFLYNNPMATSMELTKSLQTMRKLDPYNNTLPNN